MEQWPSDKKFKLTLSPSRATGKHLWGSFEFGIVRGVLRGGEPPKAVGGTVAFKWRGGETGEGQMFYGPDNQGTLTFLGDGKIYGTFEGGFTKQSTFSGTQDQEAARRQVIWGMSVKKHWKGQWRGINQRSYDAASASRWGQWKDGCDHQEKAADSDSTNLGSDYEEDWEGDEDQ